MMWERSRYQWSIREGEIPLGPRTLIMGVLHVPPKDEAAPVARDAAFERVLEIQDQGADVVDITAHPSSPSRERLTADAELSRLVPLLRKLRHNVDIPISVSTENSETAARVLDLGAAIIRDPGGLAFDPDMPRVVNGYDAGLIVTHSRGTPDTWDRLASISNLEESIARDLDSALARARSAGIDRRRIVIDPGLGLGKRGLENYRILGQLSRLALLQQPVLVSLCRQPFLTDSIRAPESEWLFATAAAVTMAIGEGAHIVRVDEVSHMAQVAKAADRVFEAAGSR